MPFWSRLFGGTKEEPAAAGSSEEYKGFRITAKPIREGGSYRIAARIEKEVAGVPRVHELVRADTVASLDEARALSVTKARQIIAEQGDGLFG